MEMVKKILVRLRENIFQSNHKNSMKYNHGYIKEKQNPSSVSGYKLVQPNNRGLIVIEFATGVKILQLPIRLLLIQLIKRSKKCLFQSISSGYA